VKPAAALNIGQQHKLLVGYILPYIALEGKLELSQSVVQIRQAFLWTTAGMKRAPPAPANQARQRQASGQRRRQAKLGRTRKQALIGICRPN
jgi:hypothetical protein